MQIKDNLKVTNTGRYLAGQFMWEVERKGWFFWHHVGYIWAATPKEALDQFIHGVT